MYWRANKTIAVANLLSKQNLLPHFDKAFARRANMLYQGENHLAIPGREQVINRGASCVLLLLIGVNAPLKS